MYCKFEIVFQINTSKYFKVITFPSLKYLHNYDETISTNTKIRDYFEKFLNFPKIAT